MRNDCVIVTELESSNVTSNSSADHHQQQRLRFFALSYDAYKVELCSLGASITKFLIESDGKDDESNNNHNKNIIDIVLGYKDGTTMYDSGNPVYFSAIVGRVANRIAKGQFSLNGKLYNLETNNGPNHLHGGIGGFSHKIWNAKIVTVEVRDDNPNTSSQYQDNDGTNTTTTTKGVRFSLLSPDNDQGYPGTVEVAATYYLTPSPHHEKNGVILKLQIDAKLLTDTTNSTSSTPCSGSNIKTPINLAQHTYFNLAGHNDPDGILNHNLVLNSDFYTPVDDTGIPTRKICNLDDDDTMDWRNQRSLREGLIQYGITKVGLSRIEAEKNLKPEQRLHHPCSLRPYGFDHNYIVRSNNANQNHQKQQQGEQSSTSNSISHALSSTLVDNNISKVACVTYRKRELTVYSNSPGVQVYTANYLGQKDSSMSSGCKATYGPWQGLCLETQHFPDSIFDGNNNDDFHSERKNDSFESGRCVILCPDSPNYKHCIEYHLLEKI